MDFTRKAGESVELKTTVSNLPAGVTSLAGATIWSTGRNLKDGSLVWQRTWTGSNITGLVVVGLDINWTVQPSDTYLLTSQTQIYWDVKLKEATTGRETVLEDGFFTVTVPATQTI